MVFLDTNVFLYAAGAPHPLKEPCANVLRRAAAGSLEATTNAEVIQEILYVIDRRRRRPQACQLARNIAALFPGLLPLTGADMLRSCELLDRYSHLSVRDAIHAATMINNQIERIISVDPDFDQISEIRRIEPS